MLLACYYENKKVKHHEKVVITKYYNKIMMSMNVGEVQPPAGRKEMSYPMVFSIQNKDFRYSVASGLT